MSKDRTVQIIDDVPFTNVEWGRTKELVGRYCEAQSDNLLIKITEYLPHFQHKKHVHPGQEEVQIVLSGRAITETDSGKIDLYPGCISHVPADLPHATYNPYDETCRCIIIKSPADKDQFKS